MTFVLRDYQETLLSDTRAALRQHPSVLIQLPTGGGKTAIGAKMLANASSKGHRTMFVVHRQELIDQSAIAFDKVGIEFGIICAGFRPRYHAPVQIASIDTLKRRITDLAVPALCVWDECHHVAAAGWAAVFGYFSKSKHVGLSATPQRLDGRGLRDWFKHMVRGPTVEKLIARGFLAPFKIYCPGGPDLKGVGKQYGEFKRRDLEGVMDSGTITGDAIKQYRQHADGKLGIAFCVSVVHSQHVAQKFRDAGIPAVHLDGETDRDERRRIMAAFRRREIKVLTNVDLFGEGVDVPGVEVISMLRPTQSLALYLQQAGRAARPAEGKENAIILDHAGNVMRHGLPDDDREWSLDGKGDGDEGGDGEKGPRVRTCPRCFMVHKPAPKCPSCGYRYEAEGREIDVKEGDLVEVDVEAIKAARKKEEREARTLEQLIALGKKRGYQSPERWAMHRFEARQKRLAEYFASRYGA